MLHLLTMHKQQGTQDPGIEPRTVEPNRTNRTVCELLFSQAEPNRTVQRKTTESLGLELGEQPDKAPSDKNATSAKMLTICSYIAMLTREPVI